MGTAMLRAFLQSGQVQADNVTVSDPDPEARTRAADLGVSAIFDNISVASKHSIILVGTEPEDVPEVLLEISKVVEDEDRMLISIAVQLCIKL